MIRWIGFLVVASVLVGALLAQALFVRARTDGDPLEAIRQARTSSRADADSTDTTRSSSQGGEPVGRGLHPRAPVVPRFVQGRPGSHRADTESGGPHASAGDANSDADRGTRYGFASDTTALLIDVTVSQALFAGLLGVAAVLAGVPSAVLGLGPDAIELGAVGNGLALGAGFWLGSTGASVLARRAGYPVGSRLRSLIAPDSVGGWLLLVGVALPVVAVSEEFVFRAALVGAASAGLGISPWPAVVVGGLAFGVAHVGQGRIGMALAGALGVLLGGAFVLSGSLLTVVVAHYVVNLLEMVVYALSGQDEGPFGSA